MRTRPHIAAIFILSVLPSATHAQKVPTDYAHRDGAAEARALVAARRPAQIFTYEFAGRLAVNLAPGILECSGGSGPGQIAPRLFVALPEADYQEGVDTPNDRFALAAMLYAGQFNREIVKLRPVEVRARCPRAALDPRWPQTERAYSAELAWKGDTRNVR